MSSKMPEWPKEIRREGPYKVYKDRKYTVYDDGNSAETPYQTDLAEAALARLRLAVDHINHSPRCAMMQPVGKMACDCGYREALDAIGPLPAQSTTPP